MSTQVSVLNGYSVIRHDNHFTIYDGFDPIMTCNSWIEVIEFIENNIETLD